MIMNFGPEVVDGKWEQVDPLPEPEAEGGYLTEEWLEAFRTHKFSPRAADTFLAGTLKSAMDAMDMVSSVKVTPTRVRFATGGWSGAEELIEIALEHLWIAHRHIAWKRGGLFVFEIPRRAIGDERGEG